MRKEYNNRWDAPLVNPGFTMCEYEANRANLVARELNIIQEMNEILDSIETQDAESQKAFFAQVKLQSEALGNK